MGAVQVTQAMVIMVQLKVRLKAINSTFDLNILQAFAHLTSLIGIRGRALCTQASSSWGLGFPGSLAWEKEQVSQTAQADLCQEGGARGGWRQLVKCFWRLSSCFQVIVFQKNILTWAISISLLSVHKNRQIGIEQDIVPLLSSFDRKRPVQDIKEDAKR